MIDKLLKSVIEQDKAAVVICDLNHTIVYMNPAADRNYKKSGGYKLVGTSLFDCHNERSNELIKQVVAWFAESKDHNIIYTYYNEKKNMDEYMVALRDEEQNLIGYYEKHEYRDKETAKRYDFS